MPRSREHLGFLTNEIVLLFAIHLGAGRTARLGVVRMAVEVDWTDSLMGVRNRETLDTAMVWRVYDLRNERIFNITPQIRFLIDWRKWHHQFIECEKPLTEEDFSKSCDLAFRVCKLTEQSIAEMLGIAI